MTAATTHGVAAWAADVAELAKPRITFLIAVTTVLGLYVGLGGSFGGMLGVHTLLGTIAVVAGANTLNQALEKDVDGRMARTADRPLPAGRRTVTEAMLIGIGLGCLGTIYLAYLVNLLTALIGFIALISYVLLYTPLKRRTWLCTIVGAAPGAMPPVMGWTAARGELGLGAVALFAILFFWQLPHFWAIGWMYRDEYAGAGLPMLPVIDESGRRTALYSILACAALVGVSVLPTVWGVAGVIYAACAIAVGIVYLWSCIVFATDRSHAAARRILLLSIIYLPVIAALMMVDST